MTHEESRSGAAIKAQASPFATSVEHTNVDRSLRFVEVSATTDRLRVSEGRLAIAMRSAPVIFFTQGTGRRDEELVESAEEAAALWAIKERVIATGQGERHDVEITTGDDQRAYDLIIEPLRGGDGEVVGVSCAAVDITARRQAEAERERLLAASEAARAQAERAMRTRDDLFALISHDLSSPLTIILAQAKLLARHIDQPPIDAERLAYGLALIESAAAQLNAQLKELVDLARADGSTPLPLDHLPIDLVAIARSVVESGQATTTRHQLRLKTDGCDELICICDGSRIRRAIANLVTNAIAYSPDGGEIVVRVAPDGKADGWALISVQDSGLGIPAADLPHIFERFRRGANVTERSRGTGLGLASVRHIVDQHRGQVRVASIEGQGSTFTVLLPLRRVRQK